MNVLLDQKETHGPGLFRVNMTPLIDVSLVLVVTLLLMTPLALESGIWVRNQDQTTFPEDRDQRPHLVSLNILSENLVQVDNRILQRDHLQPVLGAMLRRPGYDGVTLRCADEVSHAVFVEVLDKAKLSGAVTIAIADEGGGTP